MPDSCVGPYFVTGELSKAVSDYGVLLKHTPEDVEARYQRGYVYEKVRPTPELIGPGQQLEFYSWNSTWCCAK